MKPKIIQSKKCLECGVVYCKKLVESRKYWARKKYCSARCSRKNTLHLGRVSRPISESHKESLRRAMIGKPGNSGSFKKGQVGYWAGKERLDARGEKKVRTIINCKQCGTEKRLAPNEVRDGRKFCSALCYSTWHCGTNSPVYKGENAVSRFRNRIWQLPEYRQWRLSILKRDGYRCVLCSSKHTKEAPLEVDHIKRFLYIANQHELRTPEDARKCAELWDIKNGRTLCRPCHRISDTYGTKGLSKLINQK